MPSSWEGDAGHALEATKSCDLNVAQSSGEMSRQSSAQQDYGTFPMVSSSRSPSESSCCGYQPDLASRANLSPGCLARSAVAELSPIYRSVEKGAINTLTEQQVSHVTDIVASHLHKKADPALGLPSQNRSPLNSDPRRYL